MATLKDKMKISAKQFYICNAIDSMYLNFAVNYNYYCKQ